MGWEREALFREELELCTQKATKASLERLAAIAIDDARQARRRRKPLLLLCLRPRPGAASLSRRAAGWLPVAASLVLVGHKDGKCSPGPPAVCVCLSYLPQCYKHVAVLMEKQQRKAAGNSRVKLNVLYVASEVLRFSRKQLGAKDLYGKRGLQAACGRLDCEASGDLHSTPSAVRPSARDNAQPGQG